MTKNSHYYFNFWISFPHVLLANLAINGNATQSGVYDIYDASKALDGNRDQIWEGGSCTHTALQQKSAWWRLDLGDLAYINRIIIYYRQDSKYIHFI